MIAALGLSAERLRQMNPQFMAGIIPGRSRSSAHHTGETGEHGRGQVYTSGEDS